MRKSPGLQLWFWMVVIALTVGGGLTVAVWRSRAATPALWTERHQAAPGGNPPWVAVAQQNTPAVVNIRTTQVLRNPLTAPGPGGPAPESRRPMLGDLPRTLRTQTLGSGFLIRPDGYLVTNNHLVQAATAIQVKLPDGRELRGRVVGRDEKTDLALLKIEATGLPVLAFGDSDRLQIGEPIMAIGNPFGLEGTVTTGIVSAKGRVIGEGPYDDFIQTDASINPGNSGGPLVNAAGQVVGITTAIASQSGGSVGIGFAIPSNAAKALLPQLEATGRVTRGWLGVSVQPVTTTLAKALRLPEAKGALISQVMAGSPAAQAGLQPGDVIVEFDGQAVGKENDLPRLVAATAIGKAVTLKVLRESRPLTLTAKVAELPQPPQEAAPPASPDRDRLGLKVLPLTPKLAQELGLQAAQTGIVVAEVQGGSRAAEAGIRPGDVILQVNRQPVKTGEDFRQAIAGHPAEAPAVFLLQREDARLFVAVEGGGKGEG